MCRSGSCRAPGTNSEQWLRVGAAFPAKHQPITWHMSSVTPDLLRGFSYFSLDNLARQSYETCQPTIYPYLVLLRDGER